MNEQEIFKYATQITDSTEKTVIELNSGEKIYGYFNKNIGTKSLESNIWNFVKTPKNEHLDSNITLNGNDILSIDILKITD